jgi:hypothetical protein
MFPSSLSSVAVRIDGDPLPLKPNANGCDNREKNDRCIEGEKQRDLIWCHAGHGS